jgi:4-amino-4-deoxy-L-arabinose transferase-like glycosyltransferase
MFATGDWLFPRLNGELYISKPPLIYWLAAEVSWLFGTVNEWTVRLPSAMAASAIAIVIYRYMRTRFGAWPALFAVQLLIANVSFAMFARRAEIEMLLTALCFFSFLSAM